MEDTTEVQDDTRNTEVQEFVINQQTTGKGLNIAPESKLVYLKGKNLLCYYLLAQQPISTINLILNSNFKILLI